MGKVPKSMDLFLGAHNEILKYFCPIALSHRNEEVAKLVFATSAGKGLDKKQAKVGAMQ